MPALAGLAKVSPKVALVKQRNGGFRVFLGIIPSLIRKFQTSFHNGRS